MKEWHKTHEPWQKSNKNRINERNKRRRKYDVQYRLTCNLRSRLVCALNGRIKVGSAISDMGCTVKELKLYLEFKFQPGMSWANWGNRVGYWSVDHIAPLSKFDLTNREEFLKACHYTNLQPMWHVDNVKKGNK